MTPLLHEKYVPQKFKHLHYYPSQFPLLIFQRLKKVLIVVLSEKEEVIDCWSERGHSSIQL